jgi:osmoprotectant transport system permease protein
MSHERRAQLISTGITTLLVALLIVLALRSLDYSYFQDHREEVFSDTVQHVKITLATLGISLAIAIPVGTLIARIPILYTPLIGLFGIIYTIPSLAFLAFLVPTVGIGLEPALIALVAYAQFILVRNVVVGLREVDRATIEAARGMGMTSLQILLKIEYPLALPVILGGLRVATVATIAIATIASLIAAGGLGHLLFDGIEKLNGNSEILVGATAVSLLAIAADILFRVVDRLLPATRARQSGRR